MDESIPQSPIYHGLEGQSRRRIIERMAKTTDPDLASKLSTLVLEKKLSLERGRLFGQFLFLRGAEYSLYYRSGAIERGKREETLDLVANFGQDNSLQQYQKEVFEMLGKDFENC